jgi:hypothetical protein
MDGPWHPQPVTGIGQLPSAGAVILISNRESGSRAERRARRPFAPQDPQIFQDGPLTVGLLPDRHRELHVSDSMVCLFEGALYDTQDSVSPAADLAEIYERHGDRVLPELRGEFWALLWDRAVRSGIVVCDQLGSRAPYWTADGATTVIASEVPELLATLSQGPNPIRSSWPTG